MEEIYLFRRRNNNNKKACRNLDIDSFIPKIKILRKNSKQIGYIIWNRWMKLVYFLDLVVSGCVSFLGMGSLARLRGLRSLLFCFYYRDKTPPSRFRSIRNYYLMLIPLVHSVPFEMRSFSVILYPSFFSFLRPTWSELIFIAWLILFCYNSNETDICYTWYCLSS